MLNRLTAYKNSLGSRGTIVFMTSRIDKEQFMAAKPQFITASAAARLVGCDRRNIVRLARNGLIGTYHLPDGADALVKYNREDCLKIAKGAHRPAAAGK